MLRLSERVSVKDRVFRTSSGQIDAFAADAVAGRALGAADHALGRPARPAGRAPAAAAARRRRGGRRSRATRRSRRRAPPRFPPTRRAARSLRWAARPTSCAASSSPSTTACSSASATSRRCVARRWPSSTSGGWRAGGGLRPPPPASRRPPPAAASRHPAGSLDRRSPGAGAASGPARGAAPAVVLRLRPGEEPATWERIGALCLDLRAGDDLELVVGGPGGRPSQPAWRCGSALPRSCSTTTDPGRRRWRPWGGTPCTPVTSRRCRGPTRSCSSTRCRA